MSAARGKVTGFQVSGLVNLAPGGLEGAQVAGLVNLAKYAGALCIEVNPQPSGNPAFDDVIAESADTALPTLFRA